MEKGESDVFETIEIEQVQAAARPDGKKALLLYLKGGRKLALEMSPERIRLLKAKLSTLLSLPSEPAGRA